MHADRDIYSVTRNNYFQVAETQESQASYKPSGNPRIFQSFLPQSTLSAIARRVCKDEGIDYDKIPARERFLLVRFRCSQCGMRPLYLLDFQHSNKAKCLTCMQLVNVKNRGKYGRIRKKVAIESFRIMRSGELPFIRDGNFATIKELAFKDEDF